MLLVFAVSFIDDCIGLPASLRLGVQAAAAFIIIGGVGLKISSISLPEGPSVQLGLATIPVSALFLIWMANLYNFMDGMDGFAGGMTLIGFSFLAYFGWEAHFPVMLIIATFVAMGALGFLVYNFLLHVFSWVMPGVSQSVSWLGHWCFLGFGTGYSNCGYRLLFFSIYCRCDRDANAASAPSRKGMGSASRALLPTIGFEWVEPSQHRVCRVWCHASLRSAGCVVSPLHRKMATYYSRWVGNHVSHPWRACPYCRTEAASLSPQSNTPCWQ